MISESKVTSSDSSDGDNVLQGVPFSTNVTDNGILEVFQKSVNSVSQEENLLFSDLVQEANDFSIRSRDDVKNENLPEKYQNLKLIIDKNGKMRVPNLFQINDRPEMPSLLQRYLAMQQSLLEKEQKTLAEIEEELEDLRSNEDAEFGFIGEYFDGLNEEETYTKELDKDFKQSEKYVTPDRHENRNIGEGLELYSIQKTLTTTPSTTTSTTTPPTTTTGTTTTTTSTTTQTTTSTTTATSTTTTSKRVIIKSTPTPRRIIIKSTRRPDGSLTREFINSLSSSGEKENVKDFLKYSQFDIETFLKRAKKRKTKVVQKSIPKKRQEESKTINRKNDISKISATTRFPHFQPNKNQNKRRKHFKTHNVLLEPIIPKTDIESASASLDFSQVSTLDNELAVETEDCKRELTQEKGVQIPNNSTPKPVLHSAIKETNDNPGIAPLKSNFPNTNLEANDPQLSQNSGQTSRVTPINGTFVPVPNWRNNFQPYLVTTTRPDTSTTQSYEFAGLNSFVSINLGPKEVNKEVYPFAESVAINSKPDLPVTKDVVEDSVEAASISTGSTQPPAPSAHNNEDKSKKLPPKIPAYLSSIYHVVPPSPHPKKENVFNLPSPSPIQHVFPQFPTSTFPPFDEDSTSEDKKMKLTVLENTNNENYIPMSIFRNNPPVEVSTLPPFLSRPTPFPNLPHLFPQHHPTTVRPAPVFTTRTTPYPIFHHSTTPLPLPHHTTPLPPAYQMSTTRPSILHPHSFHISDRVPPPYPLSPSVHKVTPLPIFYNSVTPTSRPRPEPTYRYSTLAPSSSLPSLAPAFFTRAAHHIPSPPPQINISSDPLLDSAFAPSTRDETIILGDEFKPKRNSIAEVLKSFKQRTYVSLQSPRNEDSKSFSYQKYTTPAQNVNILSEHSTTTTVRPPAIFHSPTPKLLNPFELVSVDKAQSQSLWRDSDIVLSFKSEPEAPLPPDESKNPQYSQENFYSSSVISSPIRFQQVTGNLRIWK